MRDCGEIFVTVHPEVDGNDENSIVVHNRTCNYACLASRRDVVRWVRSFDVQHLVFRPSLGISRRVN